MVWPTGRTTRRSPRPPRCRPGPPAAPQPQAASMPTRAARVLDETIALHNQGIFELDRLDRKVRGVRDVDLDAILAVLRETSAEPSSKRLKINVIAPMTWVVSEE